MTFTVGQRVRLTDEAVARGFQGRASTTGGVVVGIPGTRGFKYRASNLVSVRRDGIQTPETYAAKFWRLEATGIAEACLRAAGGKP